ncbi:unnamed protein product [Sphagnum troendelagicum]|uniref:Uncharacterized protein n=1 Tax=Sphagnum troendelagicum TaxID=128251 RepID=A0ABP0U4N7_9BRYO
MHDSKASMYNPNNSGLSGQPYFTPIVYGNVLERPSVGCDTVIRMPGPGCTWTASMQRSARPRQCPPTLAIASRKARYQTLS